MSVELRARSPIQDSQFNIEHSPFLVTLFPDEQSHSGREQGSTADTTTVYVELFRELYAAQRERQALVDVQTKLAQINQDLDSAMVEALSSSFEFVRAGGK